MRRTHDMADVYRRRRIRYGWRWWAQTRWKDRISYQSHRLRQRPHIGRRRVSTVTYYGGEGDVAGDWLVRRHRRGRPARLVKPAVALVVEQVPAGPYLEDYAEYTMAPWWRRRIQAARARRGANLWRRVRWPHPLQRKH
jgi:hypothetical protein